MEQEKKGVGLNPNNHTHLTEHLAPICIIMDIPLLLTDENHAQDVQKLYPGSQILLANWLDVTPEYLTKSFDVFFQSQIWHRHEFYSKMQAWEKKYNKTIRNVHCPHGFSDKISWFEKSVWEDILLVYGENMLNLFRESKVSEYLNTTVRTGNYRYLYYQQHQAFYDQLMKEKIWSRLDSSKPTILYAPTYKDAEHTTSFFDAIDLLEKLPKDYNLIVKLHPSLEENDEHLIYPIIGKYEKKENIIFIQNFPPVYPLLACSDIYVGDMSSIGYDFLVFNRPMFFLNQLKRDSKRDRNAFLYRCGTEITPEQYKNFYNILETQLSEDQQRYSTIRQEVYRYTFGEEISFDHLKKAIIDAYSSPKKWD